MPFNYNYVDDHCNGCGEYERECTCVDETVAPAGLTIEQVRIACSLAEGD